MPCTLHTPTAILNAVLSCVQTALADTEHGGLGIPSTVALGADGAGDAYSCCTDGLLTIESGTLEPRDPDLTGVSSTPCDTVWVLPVTIGVRRCVETFDKIGGATDGSPVDPDVRTAAALAIAGEAWLLLQTLICCRRESWRTCGVVINNVNMIPPSGMCFGHDTHLTFELTPCCP